MNKFMTIARLMENIVKFAEQENLNAGDILTCVGMLFDYMQDVVEGFSAEEALVAMLRAEHEKKELMEGLLKEGVDIEKLVNALIGGGDDK